MHSLMQARKLSLSTLDFSYWEVPFLATYNLILSTNVSLCFERATVHNAWFLYEKPVTKVSWDPFMGCCQQHRSFDLLVCLRSQMIWHILIEQLHVALWLLKFRKEPIYYWIYYNLLRTSKCISFLKWTFDKSWQRSCPVYPVKLCRFIADLANPLH